MTAGTRPSLRSFLLPARRANERGYAVKGTVFISNQSGALQGQLVRPPLNSKSEVNDELLCIRLIASPSKPDTDKVVIFTPSIAGRRTVSVVINSSILDLRNLSTPRSF